VDPRSGRPTPTPQKKKKPSCHTGWNLTRTEEAAYKLGKVWNMKRNNLPLLSHSPLPAAV